MEAQPTTSTSKPAPVSEPAPVSASVLGEMSSKQTKETTESGQGTTSPRVPLELQVTHEERSTAQETPQNSSFVLKSYLGHSIATVPSHLLDPHHENAVNATQSTEHGRFPFYEALLPQSSSPENFATPVATAVGDSMVFPQNGVPGTLGVTPTQLLISHTAPNSASSMTQKLSLNQQRDPANTIAPSCLLPTPIRPSNSVLLNDIRARGQSVSFCDPEGAEKSRRFTISAQPLNAALASGSRQNSYQTMPARKASVHADGPPNLSRSGSSLAFNAPHHHMLSNYRIESPKLREALSSRQASALELRFSPLPPPLKPAISSSIGASSKSPVPGNGHATFSPELPATVLGRSSRQGSDAGTQPISILRRNSLTKKSNKTVVESPVGPPVPFQQFLLKEDDKKVHILMACTGSVATIKVPLIIDRLFQVFGTSKISVQLVVTKCAGHFLKGLKIRKDVKIWRDEDEWANFSEWNLNATTTASTCEVKKQRNPHEKMILHNELRKWADIMLIAPLSANTLAKIAHGISDNLLTSIIRSWGVLSGIGGQVASKKPILVAPAMNTFMYTHPLTAKQLKILSLNEEGFAMEVLKPVEKVLVCGDIGMGGMREWLDIVETMRKKIKAIFAERQAEEGVEMPLDERDDEDVDDDDDDDKNDDYDDDDDDEDDDDDDDDDDEGDDTNDDSRTDEGVFGPADQDDQSVLDRPKAPEYKTSGIVDLARRKDELAMQAKRKLIFETDPDRNSEDVERALSPSFEEAKAIL